MNLADIVALAKAGYTFTQVKELLENKEIVQEEMHENVQTEDVTTEEIHEETTNNSIETSTENNTKEIETLKEELEKSKQALKDLQKSAINKDLSENLANNNDIVSDIVRSFM